MQRFKLSPGAGIPARYANRHALVTGPTGTGKSVTLLTLAESMTQCGVPVFLSDVKGDLTAIARTRDAVRIDPLGGAAQVPIWAMGPDLIARCLELTETQGGALEITFAHAERAGLPLDTIADLRRAIAAVMDERAAICQDLGQVSPASLGVVQRGLLRLERAGVAPMFGPHRIDIAEWLVPGRVTILDATRLFQVPRAYGAFLLWLLRETWQRMPERGDAEFPAIGLFFDEAHTVFNEAGSALLRQTEQAARLVRSKGVALVWASQTASDIPDIITAQCATRIAHSRELGVGHADFVTLDRSGRATQSAQICPALPECGTAPEPIAEPVRAAPTERAAELEPVPAWHGLAFVAILAVLGLIALI